MRPQRRLSKKPINFAFAAFLSFLLTGGPSFAEKPLPVLPSVWERERKELFPELTSLPLWSERLELLARLHAEDLMRRGILSHRDLQNRNAAERAAQLGFPEGDYGEIVGAGPNREAIWKAWRLSPPHRELLLEKGWSSWGGAQVVAGDVVVCVIEEYRPPQD